MRSLWMLLLEFSKLLLHVFVIRGRGSLDFLGNFLTALGGFFCTSLNLLCSAFHLFDGLK